jgi:polyhydroxyalkanoate synthesis regulator phasin
MRLFNKKLAKPSPLLIIKKGKGDENVKEYSSIEEAITDLENDPNVSHSKIEKLRLSLNNLKNKTTIRIRNGEII